MSTASGAAEPTKPGWHVYAGLFTVTLATLMHEILLTRIFSVTMWYHFAFLAISVAMFGMTVGAILVYLRPKTFTFERASEQMAKNSLLYAVTLVIGFLVYLQIPFLPDGSLSGTLLLAASYITIAVPFVFSGITVAVALTKFPGQVSRLYAADLLGAALGCVLLIWIIEVTGGETAVLVVATLIGAASALFGLGAGGVWKKAPAVVSAVLAVAVVWHLSLVARNQPIIQVTDTSGKKSGEYPYAPWNSHSRVTVWGDPFKPKDATGWGLSEKTGATKAQVHQLAMAIDTWAGTVITRYDGNPAPHWYLKDDVTNMAHHLRKNADVYVIGVGGGRDVLSALVFGQHSVTGVEINRNVLRATTEEFGDFAGHLEDDPRVDLHVDEARSFITRSDKRFDIVEMSLIDTWAATAAGAFVLSENSLYTKEAWVTFLKRLKPHGILTVSRWYYPTRPGEALRITSLARESLLELGVDDPRKNVIMVISPKASGLAGALGNGIATILVSPQPFSDADVATVQRESARLGFVPILTPKHTTVPEFETILSGKNIDAFYEAQPLDITAPTDDKPFFFQMLRFEDFGNSLGENWLDPNKSNLEAIRILALVLLVVTVLTVLCIGVPLLLTFKRGTLKGSAPLLGFFMAIGLGFMFIEISQMQRLMVFLGHPTYALSVVLFTLLVGSGIGSYVSGRLVDGPRHLRPIVLLAVLVGVLVVFGLITPSVVRAFGGATNTVRIGSAAAILFSIGIFMGAPFPLGMRVAATRSADLTPWLWGINGAASVFCSVLATVVAISFGISTSFWIGVACYGVALGTFALASRPAAA